MPERIKTIRQSRCPCRSVSPQDAQRRADRRFYSSSRWRKFRLQRLRTSPLCERYRRFWQNAIEVCYRKSNYLHDLHGPSSARFLFPCCGEIRLQTLALLPISPTAIAEAICENGKGELLDLCGTVRPNELRPAVEKTTKKWFRCWSIAGFRSTYR